MKTMICATEDDLAGDNLKAIREAVHDARIPAPFRYYSALRQLAIRSQFEPWLGGVFMRQSGAPGARWLISIPRFIRALNARDQRGAA